MVIQLGLQPTYPIRGNDAYRERLAIIQESWPADQDFMGPHRIASEDASKTRYSVTATAALNDQNWVALMEWMVTITMKHGARIAVEIWFEIQRKVELERVVRGRIEESLRPSD
jgi:hypothetical protein